MPPNVNRVTSANLVQNYLLSSNIEEGKNILLTLQRVSGGGPHERDRIRSRGISRRRI